MAKTKEEKAEVRRLYYQKNKEVIKNKVKNWVEKNKDKRKEYNKKYVKEHSEQLKERVILWRKNNYDKYIESRRKRENNPIYSQSARRIYKALKCNSKRRKMEILISLDDFIKWHTEKDKKCYYCGIDEIFVYDLGFSRLEIERKDNSKTYEIDNIELACKFCNSVKGNILSEKEMKFIGEQIIIKKWKQLKQ